VPLGAGILASFVGGPGDCRGTVEWTHRRKAGSRRIAGSVFELLAVNTVDDYVMATPAISNGSLFVHSQHYLPSLGKKANGNAR